MCGIWCFALFLVRGTEGGSCGVNERPTISMATCPSKQGNVRSMADNWQAVVKTLAIMIGFLVVMGFFGKWCDQRFEMMSGTQARRTSLNTVKKIATSEMP